MRTYRQTHILIYTLHTYIRTHIHKHIHAYTQLHTTDRHAGIHTDILAYGHRHAD